MTTEHYDSYVQKLESIKRLDSQTALAECERNRIDLDDVTTGIRKRIRRLDAGETANLARALLYLRAQSIDVVYARTGFREVLPIKTDVPEGATTYGVPQFDHVGQAKLITNYGDDLPRVNIKQSETIQKIHRYGTSYEYSIDDLAAAAMSGNMLDSKRQLAAKQILERKHDVLAIAGDSTSGLGGFANNADVEAVALANAGTWAAKSAANEGYKILADIQKLVQNVIDDTQGELTPTHLAMPKAMEFLIRTTTMSTTDSRTVKQALLDAGLNMEITLWQRLATADAGADGPRIVAYSKDPNVVEYVAPGGGFTEESPQMRNLAFVVNCHGKSAGSCIYQPEGMSYMDVG